MDAADDPTLEDLLAVARFGHAFAGSRAGVDLTAAMRAVRRRALIAGRHRAARGAAHPRFGDGSISAASALALRALGVREGEIVRFRDLIPALGAACAVWGEQRGQCISNGENHGIDYRNYRRDPCAS
ncbi:hypothetical protein [Rubrimonas sp.]|uniref:hypothetical protein n=1 Tax=Rubrimonas sp. TaxID=2036015 RepID=UPI002FDCD506